MSPRIGALETSFLDVPLHLPTCFLGSKEEALMCRLPYDFAISTLTHFFFKFSFLIVVKYM